MIEIKFTCNAPRPLNKVGAAPPIKSKGDSAICAFFSPVILFVTPLNV